MSTCQNPLSSLDINSWHPKLLLFKILSSLSNDDSVIIVRAGNRCAGASTAQLNVARAASALTNGLCSSARSPTRRGRWLSPAFSFRFRSLRITVPYTSRTCPQFRWRTIRFLTPAGNTQFRCHTFCAVYSYLAKRPRVHLADASVKLGSLNSKGFDNL